MADQIDQLYPSRDPVAYALEKYNKGRAATFRQNIPPDQPILIVGLATTTLGTAAQRRALETQIEAITGVTQAKVLVYGTSAPAGDIPVDHHLELHGELRQRIEPDPEVE